MKREYPIQTVLFYKGQEAKKVYDDAQRMLKEIIASGSLTAHGVVGFYPACSIGDDIEVYSEKGETLAVLHGLRQQVKYLFSFGQVWKEKWRYCHID